jgi:hypothetical protein
MDQTKKSGVTLAVVLLIVGLAIGFGVTFGVVKAADNNTLNTAQIPTSATKAADFRADFVTLGVEHMTYTDQAIDAALDGSPNAAASAAALYANGNSIGAAVGSIYGSSAQTTFDSVWKIHLDQFVAYAVADSKGDTTAMQTALNTIQTQYTIPLAQYLAKANPNLPESTLQSALTDHVQMTAAMIDDHVKGNYTAEAAQLDMANTHIEGLFSTLAAGIVKQYPSKF